MELDLKAQKEYENRTLVKQPALFASLRSHSCVYAPHLVLSTKVSKWQMPLRHRGTKVPTAPWCFEYQGAVGASSVSGPEHIITSFPPLHSDFSRAPLPVSPLPPLPAQIPRPHPPSPFSTLAGAPNQFCCLRTLFCYEFCFCRSLLVFAPIE